MYEKRKVERKKRRFTAKLISKNILCSGDPRCNIVLCNFGQATGLTNTFIMKLLSNLSIVKIPKLIIEKGETHSFLCFSNIEDALLFYKTYDCQPVDDDKNIIYMSFVESVPNMEVMCRNNMPTELMILENFISIEEEKKLITLFDWEEESSSLKNRQVKHYGYEFRYGTNDVDLNSPLDDKIPGEFDILWYRLQQNGIILEKPNQLTVNKYEPGQGIPSHVDSHSPFGGTILSLSLCSPVVMDWRHHSGKHVPVLVPNRSLLVMQGEARYDWHHGIQPRTWDPVIEERIEMVDGEHNQVRVITSDCTCRGTRISLTFRWTRSGPCECDYKTLCDSFEQKSTRDIEDELATNLEELHVHQVYEQIAGHFSTTRHKPWPKVVEFMQQVTTGSIVLDLGCGNGKNILKRTDILQIGGERSIGLLGECKQHIADIRSADCVRLDLLNVGLRDCCADIIICIAVVHHLSSKARRLQAISSIARLLRPGGRALITVWAKDQTKSNYLCKNKRAEPTKESHITVAGVNLPVHENRTQFQHNDLLVPWKLRTKKENKLSDQPENSLLRYYHVFEKGELDELCLTVPNLIVDKSFYEEGNWCVVCRKKVVK